MNEIQILDKSIYNRIAAGEVVERPASVVKELIENSIDAGATAVSVEIKRGGIDYLRVADNGKGISPQDVPTAFTAHATSKIKRLSDLDSIATLGFRGEALPSIAAVADVTMTTRQANATIGFRYVINNGEVADSGEIGCPYGTTVTVENLFASIPARRKFLAKSNAEENAVTSLISKIILANPNVAITYTSDGKTIYRSSGMGLEQAIYCIYGADYIKNCVKVETERCGVSLVGYVGKPSFTKHAKTYQTVIVNGRYVVSEEISYWIYLCYQDFLMKRQYPTFVIQISVPFDLVDVNVHPNKLEIKFADTNGMKSLIMSTIKERVLAEARVAKEIVLDEESAGEYFLPDNPSTPPQNGVSEEFFPVAPKKDPIPTGAKMDSSVLNVPSTKTILSRETEASQGYLAERSSTFFNDLVTENTFYSIADLSKTQGGATKEEKANAEPAATPSVQQERFKMEAELKYAGKIFNTYLLFEVENDLYLIDQHAAHERLLYDKLEADLTCGKVAVQSLLIPYTFSVTADECSFIEEKLDELAAIGFIFERYDNNSFSVKGVPARCGQMNVADFLDTLLFDISQKRSVSNLSVFKEKLMQNACKSALKGETNLFVEEIKPLLQQMVSQNVVLFCPHGRPIVVKLSKTEVEKWFKRIV